MAEPRSTRRVKPKRHSRTPAGVTRAWVREFSTSLAILCFAAGCGFGEDPEKAAQAHLSAGEVRKAIEVLRRAVEDDPASPGLNHLLGMALLQNQQAGLAVWPLQRASRDPEHRVQAQLHLAIALLHSKNGQEAARVAGEILAEHPTHWQALRLKVNAHISEREWDQALEDLDRLIEEFPDELALLETRVSGLLAKKRIDEASATLLSLRERAADRPAVAAEFHAKLCIQSATLLVQQGDVEAARGRIESCLGDYSDLPGVYAGAVAFYDSILDSERATELLQEASAESPGRLGLQLQLAARLEALGDTEAALERLEAAAEESPSVPAQLALRDYWLRAEDLETASRYIQRALEIEARVPAGSATIDYGVIDEQRLFSYIDILVQIGDFERVAEMKNAIAEPAYLDLIEARIAYEQGDLVTALHEWDEAFVRWPSNAGARYLAAQASLKLKDFQNAVSHLRESLRSNAGLSDAGLILAEIHLAEGDLRGALNALTHHLRGHPEDTAAQRRRASLAALTGNHELRERIRVALADNFGLADEVIADQAADIAAIEGPQAALEYLEDATTDPGLDSPERSECLRAWWQLMFGLGRAEEAATRVARVAANHPEDANLQLLLATSARAQGKTETARAALERSLALAPESARVQLEKGTQEALAGNLDAALEAYDRAASLDADDPTAFRSSVAMLVQEEQLDAARARLLDRLETKPWDGSSAHTLANLAVLQERADDLAIEMASRALRFPSGMGPIPLISLGQLRVLRGEAEAAVNTFQSAIENGLGGPTLLYWLGRAHADAGERDRAIEALRTALESEDFPEAEAAARKLADLTEGVQDSESG